MSNTIFKDGNFNTEILPYVVSELLSLDNTKIEQFCTSVITELSRRYKPASVRTHLTKIRKKTLSMLKFGTTKHNLIGAKLLIDKATQAAIEGQTRSNTVDKVMIKSTFVKAAQAVEIVNRAIELLNSKKALHVGIGLLLLTGRRSSEIFHSAKFEPIKGQKHYVLFSGQLKKREISAPYNIPTLCKASTIIAAIKTVRNTYNFNDVKSVNRSLSSALNLECKKLFPELNNPTAHNLRAFYMAVCSVEFKPVDMNTLLFCGRIGGHSENDYITATSYEKYKIV